MQSLNGCSDGSLEDKKAERKIDKGLGTLIFWILLKYLKNLLRSSGVCVKDGLVVKSACCSSREPSFGSQNLNRTARYCI